MTRPSSLASGPLTIWAVNVSSLATSGPPAGSNRCRSCPARAPSAPRGPTAGRWGGEADVGPEGDLDAAAEGVTVDRGDHRDGHLLPDPRGLLTEVGDAIRRSAPGLPSVARRRVCTGHRLERAEVEPGAERSALARQHDGAHGRLPTSSAHPSRARRTSGRRGRCACRPVEAHVGDAPASMVMVTRSVMVHHACHTPGGTMKLDSRPTKS